MVRGVQSHQRRAGLGLQQEEGKVWEGQVTGIFPQGGVDQQDQQGGHLGADQASDRGAQEEQSAGHDGPADGEVGEVRLQEGLLLQE